MAQYKVGTISVTNGSAVITGSGTDWNNVLYNIKANDSVFIAGDTVDYRVLTVDSATQITLTGAVQRSTGSGLIYAVSKDFTPNVNLPLVGTGDIRTDQLFSRAMNNLDSTIGGGTFSPTFDNLTVTGSASIASADINGGAIDGTVIGATTAAAGAFTTITVDTTTLVTDAPNNRVGIGTASPLADLHVNGRAIADAGSGKGFGFERSNIAYSVLELGAVAADVVSLINPLGNDLALGTNGTERVRIKSAGNVGIGTTSPSAPLDVVGGGGTIQKVSTTSNTARIQVEAVTSPSIRFDATGGTDYTVELLASYSDESLRLLGGSGYKVLTAAGFSTPEITRLYSNNTLAVTIDAGQNVGIATTNPSEKLHVGGNTRINGSVLFDTFREIKQASSTAQGMGLIGGTSNTTGASISLYGSTNSAQAGNLYLSSGGAASTGNIIFRNYNGSSFNTHMIIKDSGNVGIGTTSPSSPFHLVGNGRFDNNVDVYGALDMRRSGTAYIRHRIGGQALSFGVTTSGGTLYYPVVMNGSNDVLSFNNSSGEMARFSSSGNVSIGTTSTQNGVSIEKSIDITPNLAGPGILLGQNSNRGWAVGYGSSGARFGASAGGSATVSSYIDIAPAAQITAVVNGSERLRINHNGNVGIGTTSPSDKLHVSGGNVRFGGFDGIGASGTTDGVHFTFDGAVASSRSGNAGLYLRRRTSDGTIAIFRRDTTTVGSISVTTTATSYNTSSDERLKRDIASAGDALAFLRAIPVDEFNWKADGSHMPFGYVAQKLHPHAPYAVTAGDASDAMWSVDHSKLVPALHRAIQQLEERVRELEAT